MWVISSCTRREQQVRGVASLEGWEAVVQIAFTLTPRLWSRRAGDVSDPSTSMTCANPPEGALSPRMDLLFRIPAPK